jgi:hypothetical protein
VFAQFVRHGESLADHGCRSFIPVHNRYEAAFPVALSS